MWPPQRARTQEGNVAAFDLFLSAGTAYKSGSAAIHHSSVDQASIFVCEWKNKNLIHFQIKQETNKEYVCTGEAPAESQL